MIKLKEVVEKYQDYEIDEEKLKEILIKPTPKNVWGLKNGDKYYTICSTNRTFIGSYTWNEASGNKNLRNAGNVFLTKEEAEFELERIKIEAILLKYGRRSFKYNEESFYIYYSCSCKKLFINTYTYGSVAYQGIIYFDTEELCKKAIEEAGEENIKKYLFGVSEE